MFQYCEETDSISGSCGWKGPDHRCDPDFAPTIGDNWDNLVRIMMKSVPSTYARVIMVNPCVKWLKPVAIFCNPTCNKFKHSGHHGDVASQWQHTLVQFDQHLSPLGCVFTGRGSDGDARRYVLQHATWMRNSTRLRKLLIATRSLQRFWRRCRQHRPPVVAPVPRPPVSGFTGDLPVSLTSFLTAGLTPGFTFAAHGQ